MQAKPSDAFPLRIKNNAIVTHQKYKKINKLIN